MRIEILAEAQDELDKAIAYHENVEPGLGLRLRAAVHEAIRWISLHPEVPPLRPKGYRRVNLRVFPYYVAYLIWSDTIWILALAHARRRPEFWIGRKNKAG